MAAGPQLRCLAVTCKEGTELSPSVQSILGNYTPAEGLKNVFQSPEGCKLYHSSGYWYFDSKAEKEIVWAAGVLDKVPTQGWTMPAPNFRNFPWLWKEIPLVVSLVVVEPLTPRKMAAMTCSEGLKTKLSNSHAVAKQKTGEALVRVRDVHAPYLKQKTGEAFVRVRDVHAPYLKQKTGEIATHCWDVSQHPDTQECLSATSRMTSNVVKFLLRGCVGGVALCLDGCAACCEPHNDAAQVDEKDVVQPSNDEKDAPQVDEKDVVQEAVPDEQHPIAKMLEEEQQDNTNPAMAA